MKILLAPTLAALTDGLQQYRGLTASDRYLKGKMPSIGDLLNLADQNMTDLDDAWSLAMETLKLVSSNFTREPGKTVPTAAPRTLLITLLVNHPIILGMMAAEGADTVLSKF
jgi:hypothetical protein